jgi:hypothetical protein
LGGNANKINPGSLRISSSVDVDACFEAIEPNANRWDYFINTSSGEIYIEVHKVNQEQLHKLIAKAEWIREKIASMGWPEVPGRPLLVAPTAGISPFALLGVLARQLALHKISIVMKGDPLGSKI